MIMITGSVMMYECVWLLLRISAGKVASRAVPYFYDDQSQVSNLSQVYTAADDVLLTTTRFSSFG